jgi:membrane-associated phospholipid phosphatase
MKKSLNLVILAVYFLQAIPGVTGLVQAQEDQPATTIEENKEIPMGTKDLEFSERSATASKWTFKTIPRELGLSMKESFWGWGALAFGLGAGLTAGVYPFDDNIQNSFEPDSLLGNTTNNIINYALAPYTIGGVSLLLWISGHASHHPKLALTGKALTEALFLSMAINWIGKLAFQRTRPNGGNFSFPSGHSTAAFSAAGVLTVFYGWKVAIPSYAVASLVGISRVDNYSHFVSDVLMGAVIGTVVGVGTAKFHKKENNRLFIVPEVSRERATVQLHYVF